MQARVFSGRVDLIIKQLHKAILNECDDDKLESSSEGYNTKKLVEHIECVYQGLVPKLQTGLSGFKNIESLDQYFKVLQGELEKLTGTIIKNKEVTPLFERFCYQK